jgi:hypothetical protein
MMDIFSLPMEYTIEAVLSIWALWVFALAYMSFIGAKEAGRLSKLMFYLGTLLLFPGYVLDVLVNLVVMTIVLRELPRWGEWTVTKRVSRHCHHGEGWRHVIGKFLCGHMLDPFQIGGHCRP